jgi:hypothetical protein
MLLIQSQSRKSRDIFNLSKTSLLYRLSTQRTIHIEKRNFPKLVSCINNNFSRNRIRLFSDNINNKLDKKIFNYLNKNNSINEKNDNYLLSNNNISNLFQKLGLSNELVKGLDAQGKKLNNIYYINYNLYSFYYRFFRTNTCSKRSYSTFT